MNYYTTLRLLVHICADHGFILRYTEDTCRYLTSSPYPGLLFFLIPESRRDLKSFEMVDCQKGLILMRLKII